jgi:hypothetical protein
MRLSILALAAGASATLALAPPAFAQMTLGAPGDYAPTQYLHDYPGPPPRYVRAFNALKSKVLETRAEDGGRLNPQHVASLQQELTALNDRYHVHPKIAVMP